MTEEEQMARAERLVADQRKRLECFVAELMNRHKISYIDIRDAMIVATATGHRMCPPEMDQCVAEVVFWLMDYEIGNKILDDYEFAVRREDEDEED